MPTKKVSGFLVICTTCNGLMKHPVDTKKEAREVADAHILMREGHKSHAGHVVAILEAELISEK